MSDEEEIDFVKRPRRNSGLHNDFYGNKNFLRLDKLLLLTVEGFIGSYYHKGKKEKNR